MVKIIRSKDPALQESPLKNVNLKVVKEIRGRLRAEEAEINELIRKIEPTAGVPRQLLNWTKVSGKVMVIGFIYNVLYDTAFDTAQGIRRKDPIGRAFISAVQNAIPFGFELNDPQRALSPVIMPNLQYGAKRGIAKTIRNFTPGAGPIDRFTGRAVTRMLEDLLGVERRGKPLGVEEMRRKARKQLERERQRLGR